MSQVLTPRTDATGDASRPSGPTTGRGRRSLVLLVVLLSLVLGTAVGWVAYTAAAGGSPDIRGADTWQARLEAEAEYHAGLERAQQRGAEQRRWEAQADHFAPGWSDE